NGRLGDFRTLRTEVLLLGGAKSPAYQKAALSALERVLPHATRVELPGVGHEAPWNAGRGGSPERVAAAMRRFFTASTGGLADRSRAVPPRRGVELPHPRGPRRHDEQAALPQAVGPDRSDRGHGDDLPRLPHQRDLGAL